MGDISFLKLNSADIDGSANKLRIRKVQNKPVNSPVDNLIPRNVVISLLEWEENE